MIKLLLAASLFLHAPAPAWEHNVTAAKAQAKKEHKLILLNFSGSDWCIPCMRMHQEIFNTEIFTNYAATNLVCVNADFPRRKKNQLEKEQQQQNDALAEQYNSKGIFPYTILLNEEGKVLVAWDGFYKDGAGSFIQEIQKARNK